jgi:arylsulfatase A-like enzyme
VRTRHLDGVAERGVIFDRFYVASPVCMPNRASLMTGRMPSLHGVRLNGVPLSRRNVTFVELLRAAGYDTALVGKSHLQNFTETPPLRNNADEDGHRSPPLDLAEAIRDDLAGEEYGIEQPEFWNDTEVEVPLPFYGFGHVDLATGHGDAPGGDYRRWLLDRAPDAIRLTGPENQLPHDYTCPQAVRTALPEELYPTTWVVERAEAYLADPVRAERPFFLNVSFPDPHHPLNPPGRFWDMYAPERMSVPAAFQTDEWTPPPHVKAILDDRAAGRANLNGMNAIGVSEREAKEARALTCGMVSMIDEGVGRLLSVLEETGLAENTVVIFTSDHGDHLGDHRMLLKGAEAYDEVIRVPFILVDPDRDGGGRHIDALASTIDIPATILDRAGLAPYAGMQGTSLMPLLDGETSLRDAVLVQYDHQRPHPGLNGPPRVHTLVDARWRLSLIHGHETGELYDLENDPEEFVNLWESQEHKEEKARLMERLAREEMASIDRVPLPTGLA